MSLNVVVYQGGIDVVPRDDRCSTFPLGMLLVEMTSHAFEDDRVHKFTHYHERASGYSRSVHLGRRRLHAHADGMSAAVRKIF
jgi:hypothetical protein